MPKLTLPRTDVRMIDDAIRSVIFRFIVLVICAANICASAHAEYFVNGKSVKASTYKAYQLIDSSLVAMKANRTDEAIDLLERALQYDPDLAEARVTLGVALARQDKTNEAENQFRTALAQNSNLLIAKLNLAALYQSSGRLTDALTLYESVIAHEKDSETARDLKERVQMLRQELENEDEAAEKEGDADLDQQSYYANVISDGKRQWPLLHMPLRVYIFPGEELVNYRPEFDRILRQSFIEWQKASYGRIQFVFVKSPAHADITCAWVDDPKKLQSTAEGGEAEVRTILNSILKVKILLLLNDPTSTFPLTDNLIRTLCLHEIGHAIGLIGHSAKASDVMYCTGQIVDKEKHLSKRDVNTLHALYKTDLDPQSIYLFQLERATGGKALETLQFTIIGGTCVIAVILFFVGVVRNATAARGKKKQKKQ